MWGRGNRGGRGGNRGRGQDRGGWRGHGQGRYFGNRDNRGGNSYNRRDFGDRQWQNRHVRNTPGKRLSEDAIGVTEFVSDHYGFLGVIKSRYADFQVSEINEQGVVAKLTDQSIPVVPEVEAEVVEDEDLLLSKYNLEILPMETWDKINTLAVATQECNDKVEVDVTGMSKEHRTKIHDAVKKAFGESIVGSTVTTKVEDIEKKFCKFEKYRRGVRIDNRIKWPFNGEYVHFIIHKENCDTMEAATTIADRLRSHIKPAMIGYAGTKDRRAKTSQWFSVRKILPKRLFDSVRALPHLSIGNFTFSKQHLKLGMLKGNRFRIALRNVSAGEAAVSIACGRLQERGFINYYGLQRFGTRVERPTFDIGLKLLKGELKEAIKYILEPREGPLQAALEVYATSCDAAAALQHAPRHGGAIELRLLRALAVNPNDLLGAINKLARNTRILYVHSYQSLVWNKVVSLRIKTHGLKPVVGDLVPLTQLQEEAINEEATGEEDEENQEESDATQDDGENKNGGNDDENIKTETADDKDKKTNKNEKVRTKEPVKILTQEDIDSGKYSIFDVIMPMPGQYIEYPPNMREYYEQLLKKDGLQMNLKNKVKSFSMSGAYRHILVRPTDFSFSMVTYKHPHDDLILSDVDELQHKRLTGIVEDGKYKGLLLTMTLPSSCYATMALRELMKVSTSGENQAAQNNYHKEDDKTTVVNEVTLTELIKDDRLVTEGDSNKRKIETEEEVDAKRIKEEESQ